MLDPFKGIADARAHRADPRPRLLPPDDLARSQTGSASRPTLTTDVAAALASIPADARVLIFGSLYLAGAVLAANGQIPD